MAILLNWILILLLGINNIGTPALFTATSAYTGTGSNNMGWGSLAWNEVANCEGVANASSAYANTATPTTISNYLRASNFGFAIPVGATINGVTVKIYCSSFMFGSGSISWNRVRLMDENLVVSTADKATGNLPAGDTEVTFGGAADTWSGDATDIDWNDSDAGVVMAVRFDSVDADAYALVDSCEVVINYTEAPAAGAGPVRRSIIGQSKFSKESKNSKNSKNSPFSSFPLSNIKGL